MSAFILLLLSTSMGIAEDSDRPARLESPALAVEIHPRMGMWSIIDKASGVRWPGEREASVGSGKGLEGGFDLVESTATSVRLVKTNGNAVTFTLVDEGRSVRIGYEGQDLGDLRVLGDLTFGTDRDRGAVIVPCREGLLIPVDSGVAFRHTFGSSEYEGCHMNMLGFLKGGAALLATWDGANVWPEVTSTLVTEKSFRQEVRTAFTLRPPARSISLTPLGKGDWNALAAGYRRIAETEGLAVTLGEKIRRNPRAELLLGAANVKLWTCLERRLDESSTRVERQRVHWTFDEAAQVAEHLKRDLGIDRCLFTIGGWTEGGYDCRHPDDLPANPECGGDQALAGAIKRIEVLGYVASLHDNYQDMYKDARSWSPDFIQKKADGSLMAGGRWLGGRAYLVCSPKQVELASRPQSLPSIKRLFAPSSYFIDTTYAVGPQVCFDPRHPLDRDGDVAWKISLSDLARATFGLFGSECGREWAVPHSDFFEGLTGVGGRPYHSLKPETLGAVVIPFWEMVYHDCEVCYGKYGYDARRAGDYVAGHLLAARALHYHSIPDHLYWKQEAQGKPASGDLACFTRSDRGWAEGLHPVDVFLKTTHEVLSPLQRATAHQRLTRFEFLGADRALRRATYGDGEEATVVVVNIGQADVSYDSKAGGHVVLPPWGFIVEGPRFLAFYARRWHGRDYPDGSLFTVRAEGPGTLEKADRVRIFHCFGDPRVDFGGSTREVRREAVVEVKPS
jgi:hypothetical protein